MKTLLVTLAFLYSVVATASDSHSKNTVTISEHSAWVRATPPGARTTAIYLTLSNTGSSDMKLVAASAEISERLELHTHKHADGMMKMQQVDFIALPSGSEALLAPHGDHIMVFDLSEPLKEGEMITLTLSFGDGSEQVVEVPVRKEGPADSQMRHTKNKHDKHKNH